MLGKKIKGFFTQLESFFSNRKNLYTVLGAAALVVCLLVFVVASLSKPSVQRFNELSRTDESRTFKIEVRDESSGDRIAVEEVKDIEEFFTLMAPLEFREEQSPKDDPGWLYTVDLFQKEREFMRVRFTDDLAEFVAYSRSNGRGYITQNEGFYIISTASAEAGIAASLDSFFEEVVLAMAEKEAEAEEEEEEKPVEVTVKEIDPAITVLVNNHPASRPSSGLQNADYVYEFLVEGGSTRYLAVFRTLHEGNFNIGPIRSLRPYFAVQSLEHGGIIAHSGYSTRTREMIQGMGVFQIADTGNNFWRDSSRSAPHNLYTNISNLYRAAGDRPQVVETTYVLDEDKPNIFGKADEIEVFYSAHNRVRYEYDEESKIYYRFINGEPHTEMETGEQYTAERVIIRETPHQNVPGPEGLVDIELHGTGGGVLYEKGYKYQVTWNRTGNQTIYKYVRGGEVKPIPGTTWIQVVRE